MCDYNYYYCYFFAECSRTTFIEFFFFSHFSTFLVYLGLYYQALSTSIQNYEPGLFYFNLTIAIDLFYFLFFIFIYTYIFIGKFNSKKQKKKILVLYLSYEDYDVGKLLFRYFCHSPITSSLRRKIYKNPIPQMNNFIYFLIIKNSR